MVTMPRERRLPGAPGYVRDRGPRARLEARTHVSEGRSCHLEVFGVQLPDRHPQLPHGSKDVVRHAGAAHVHVTRRTSGTIPWSVGESGPRQLRAVPDQVDDPQARNVGEAIELLGQQARSFTCPAL